MPEYNLTVFGPVEVEDDFMGEYKNELYQTHNIKTVGWIDVQSTLFFDHVRNNIGLIYPSCSEGQAGSVATCMHAGLVPIISQESGFNTKEFGITLEENTIKEIQTSIRSLSNSSNERIRKLSEATYHYSNSIHTRENFAKTYMIAVSKILEANI